MTLISNLIHFLAALEVTKNFLFPLRSHACNKYHGCDSVDVERTYLLTAVGCHCLYSFLTNNDHRYIFFLIWSDDFDSRLRNVIWGDLRILLEKAYA